MFNFSCVCFIFVCAGLCCCAGFPLASASGGDSVVVVAGLLSAVAPLVSECGLQGVWTSATAAHRFSCSTACEIFSDQGLSPHPLHWKLVS